MASLRTEELENKYAEHKKSKYFMETCSLCRETSLKSFKYWKIIENDFPYDRIADKHHMLVTIRHTAENNLNGNESAELSEIKEGYINESMEYDYIMEAVQSKKTIPGHFHLNLIRLK